MGHTPDCSGFVRPALPFGFAYIDELRAGDEFRFVTRSPSSRPRVARRPAFPLDSEIGLLQLESHPPESEDVIHVVDSNTIIQVVRTASRQETPCPLPCPL